MKKILLSFLLLISVFTVHLVSAYELTQRDNELLDSVEEQIFDIIDDESNTLSASAFVAYIEDAMGKRKLTEKQAILLEIIIDDISYAYYLGEYENSDDMSMTEDMCYEDEYYDEQDQMCYFDEDNYEEENEEVLSGYDGGDHEHSEDEYENETPLASYEIYGDNIEKTTGQQEISHDVVWNTFIRLIPAAQRIDFKEYHIIDSENSDTAAHVEQDDEDHTMWNMTVNLAAIIENGEVTEEGIATLIHEFAHVMTLNKRQMRYYPQSENESVLERFAENCTTNLLQEGCLSETAYLDDFIDTFWSDAEYLEQVRNEEVNAYEEEPLSYITEYAATNPGEDIAESFTYFVLKPKPTGNTIADKKLQFFYEYSELETLRKQIRSRLQ